ncbi:MAG: hypothetical protein HY899_09675 [Deltaproteobacteria bacterium]|nr:hypothetical protein [Deltaproteobacteria bacterium]
MRTGNKTVGGHATGEEITGGVLDKRRHWVASVAGRGEEALQRGGDNGIQQLGLGMSWLVGIRSDCTGDRRHDHR